MLNLCKLGGLPCLDVDLAEGMVFLEGVKLAIQLGFFGIQVESDSQRMNHIHND